MSSKNDFYVYALFRLDTGDPFYIGKGRGNRIGQTNRRNPYTRAIFNKMVGMGFDVPMIKLRTGMSETDAFEMERALIAAIGRHPNGPLSNMTDGGEGFSGGRHTEESKRRISESSSRFVLTPEQREKIRISKLGRPVHNDEAREKIGAASKLRRHSEETRERLRQAMLGRIISEEHRLKISAANKGRKLSVDVIAAMSKRRRGCKLSAEHREKIRLAGIGRKHTVESREKMRAVQKGRIITPEHKEKIRAANAGRNLKKIGQERRLARELKSNGGSESGMAG